MDEQLARKRVAEKAARSRQNLRNGGWWHSIDLGDRVTPGATTLERLRTYWTEIGLPSDLRGKRLLDIGCWDGFLALKPSAKELKSWPLTVGALRISSKRMRP